MAKKKETEKKSTSISRRDFVKKTGVLSAAGVAASSGGLAVAQQLNLQDEKRTKGTVALDWKEVWYSSCPLVAAVNVDQELGWTKELFKKIGVKYAYFRSTRENDWYPHYIHNLDNMIFGGGGLNPRIAVRADIRKTRLMGLTHVPYEGGCLLVRAKDDIYSMADMKGKKIGLSKSLNTIKNDWWRIQEEMGIEAMLKMNRMTRQDVKIVEFPYADDWYGKPEFLEPLENTAETMMKQDHKRDLSWYPLQEALLKGTVDGIYTQSKVFQHVQEATGQLAAIEDLSRYPDWRLQTPNLPAPIICTEEMAVEHPELAMTFMKGMIKVGRWANENKYAAAGILDRTTFYLDVQDQYYNLKNVDFVPNLSNQNLALVEITKNFMLSHGYIKNDFDVYEWADPQFLEQAARELLEEEWKAKTTAKLPATAAPLGAIPRIG